MHEFRRITSILPGPTAHIVTVFSHDQTMSLLNVKTLETLKATPLSESVEAATTKCDNQFLTVGEHGLLKICSLETGGIELEAKICRYVEICFHFLEGVRLKYKL